jgi:hypothetical protein
MAFEVFELELDAESRAEMAKDPPMSLRKLIESEGIEVRGLMMDVKMLAPKELTGAPVCHVYHCVSPDHMVSSHISICGGH